MDFYPDEPLDESEPQRFVWEAVRAAFGSEEGVAYYRYPVFDPSGLRRHEADILIVLRRYGVFLIEVKGLSIRNIRGIQGHVWQTASWYVPEEHPVQQADDQLFSLKDWLRVSPGLDISAQLHYAVALPFVTRAEWEEQGWHELPTTQCVRTADDLTPESLRSWVEQAAAAFPQPLSDAQWGALRDRIGRTLSSAAAEPGGAQGPPRIVRYTGMPPAADDVRTAVGLEPVEGVEPPHFYVVATAFLEVLRGGRPGREAPRPPDFAPPLQTVEDHDSEGGIRARPQLMFDNALRHLMMPWLRAQGLRLPPLGPFERLYLQRAIDVVAGDDEKLRLQLRHDAATWREVIGRLDAEGAVPGTLDASALAERLARPRMADLVVRLHEAFHAHVPAGEIPFERAVRRFLDEGLPAMMPAGPEAAPLVVMEGFSFLRPLQIHFAQRALDCGARLVFLHPYREEQAFGFEALDHTYAPLADRSFMEGAVVDVLETQLPDASDLDHARRTLFEADGAEWTPARDDSITLRAFPHRHAEVRACLEEIGRLLDRGYRPNDIRVVTRDVDGYQALLLEELELVRARQRERGEPELRPDLFRVPPRQLLLTPLGRFVLTLYNVWDAEAGALDMGPDQFATILSSGLLSRPGEGLVGYLVQRSTDRFRACVDQVFAGCRSKGQWQRALEAVRAMRAGVPDLYRLPATAVSERDVAVWTDVLDLVETLCRKLFDGTERSFAEHVERLRQELQGFDPIGMFEAERDVLRRLDEALAELERARTVPISTAQFREVLHSLVTERESHPGPWPDQVAVIGPEGVDSSRQPVVFFLGADSQSLPRAYAEPWPFFDLHLEADLAQDRYLFLAALRATLPKEDRPARFYLSYPQVSERAVLQPSPYVQEVADLLGLSAHDLVSREAPEAEAPPPPEGAPPEEAAGAPRRFRRDPDADPYTLAEVFHFGLCPYRYKLQRIDPHGRLFSVAWQQRYLAQGVWLHRLYDRWQEAGHLEHGAEAITARGRELAEAVEPDVRALFPAFVARDWHEVRRSVLHDVALWARAHLHGDETSFHPDDALTFEPAGRLAVPLVDGYQGQEVLLDLPHGRLFRVERNRNPYSRRRHFTPDALALLWLSYGKGLSSDEAATMERHGLELFTQQYPAARAWTDASKAAYAYLTADGVPPASITDGMIDLQTDLARRIEQVERGEFPKNPGPQCAYCPARPQCLGIDIPSQP